MQATREEKAVSRYLGWADSPGQRQVETVLGGERRVWSAAGFLHETIGLATLVRLGERGVPVVCQHWYAIGRECRVGA